MLLSRFFRLSRGFIVAALALVSLSACDDPFSPYWDRGTYRLRYANNHYVPTTVSEGPGTSYLEVQGGSLTVRRDHSYQLVVDIREKSGSDVFEYSKVFAGSYENEYRTLWLSYVDTRGYGRVIEANWRDGKIEAVVPGLDSGYGVLCTFVEW
jgi:hypothetical protein